MTMQSSETTGMLKSVIGYIAGALLMICVGVIGYQQTQITKLDDRMYVLQKESVDEPKLKEMKDDINANMMLQIGNIRTEIALTNRYLEKIMEENRKK